VQKVQVRIASLPFGVLLVLTFPAIHFSIFCVPSLFFAKCFSLVWNVKKKIKRSTDDKQIRLDYPWSYVRTVPNCTKMNKQHDVNS